MANATETPTLDTGLTVGTATLGLLIMALLW